MSSVNLNNFVSESPFKTAPMKVSIYDQKNALLGSFEVPEGFQLERYISTLYPYHKLEIKMSIGKFRVEVLDQNNQLVQKYVGKYSLMGL